MLALLPPFLLLSASGCSKLDLWSAPEELSRDTPFAMSLLETESCPLPEALDPKKVVIHSYRVRVRGHHDGRVPVNYFYASLLTTDGDRYLAEFQGCPGPLNGPPLRPGESADGFINFPVPPSKTPEKLVYAPELIGLSLSESTQEVPVRTSLADKESESQP